MKPISGLLHVVVYKRGSGFKSIWRHCFVSNRIIFGGLSKVFEGHILLCSRFEGCKSWGQLGVEGRGLGVAEGDQPPLMVPSKRLCDAIQ